MTTKKCICIKDYTGGSSKLLCKRDEPYEYVYNRNSDWSYMVNTDIGAWHMTSPIFDFYFSKDYVKKIQIMELITDEEILI